MAQRQGAQKAAQADLFDTRKESGALLRDVSETFQTREGKTSDGRDSLVQGHPVGIMSLESFCAQFPKVALAFSGGCDSSYLLSALIDAGVEVKAYSVRTAFQYPFEAEDARQLAADLGANYEEIEVDVLTQKEICANPADRCYLCKRFIFGTIIEHMKQDGFEVLADGTNASDQPERRPGFRALEELQVFSPLRLAGLDKEAVRTASRKRGLFTWDKPNFSCLATKIETGTSLTEKGLLQVLKDEEAHHGTQRA